MTTQKKKFSLSFVSIMFFVLTFLFSGFIANTRSIEANTNTTIENKAPYTSYKTIYYYENGISTFTTVIGCKAGSIDLYDMNTGKPCPKTTPVLIGCAVGSSHLYDVNTGKRCTNNTAPVVLSCASSSDIYDMNTGKLCVNNITVNTKTVNPIASINKESVLASELNKSATISIASQTLSTPDKPVDIRGEEGSILANEDSVSGREKLGKSLTASADKVSSIISGPMSIWIILLIVLILLGGGYGIYNLLRKNDEDGEVKKVVNNTTPATPIIPEIKSTNPQANSSQTTTNNQVIK